MRNQTRNSLSQQNGNALDFQLAEMAQNNPYQMQNSEETGRAETEGNDRTNDIILNNDISNNQGQNRNGNRLEGNTNAQAPNDPNQPNEQGTENTENRTQTARRQQQQQRERQYIAEFDESSVPQTLRDFLFSTLKWYTIILLVSITCLIAIKWKLTYAIPLGLLLVIDLSFLISILRKKISPDYDPITRKKMRVEKCLLFVKQFLFFAFKACIMASTQMDITFLTGPFALYYIYSIFISIYQKKKLQDSFFRKIGTFGLFMRELLNFQLLLICLRADNLIQAAWGDIFCVYWVLFAGSLGLSFSFAMLNLAKCCALVFAEIEKFEMKGIMWLFLFFAGNSSITCSIVLNIGELLDENDTDFSPISGQVLAMLCFNLFMTVFTISNFREIEKFLKKLFAAESDIQQEFPSYRDENKAKEPKKEPEKIDIPKFLTKSSSTYFRRATEQEVTEMKEKKDKAATKSKPQKNLHQRMQSLDYRKLTKQPNQVNPNEITASTQMGLLTIPETTERVDNQSNNLDRSIDNIIRNGQKKLEEEEKKVNKESDFQIKSNKTGVQGIVPVMSHRDVLKEDKKDESFNVNNNSTVMSSSYRGDNRTSEDWLRRSQKDQQQPEKADQPINLHEAFNNNDAESKMNSSIQHLRELRKKKIGAHRRIQSMQVTPKNMLMTLQSPKGSNNDLNTSQETPGRGEMPAGAMSPTSNRSMAGNQCLICFDNEPDAVIMECGHGGVCYECSLEIWKSTGECYLCREKITQVLQVDLKYKASNNVIKVLSSTQMVLYEEDEQY